MKKRTFIKYEKMSLKSHFFILFLLVFFPLTFSVLPSYSKAMKIYMHGGDESLDFTSMKTGACSSSNCDSGGGGEVKPNPGVNPPGGGDNVNTQTPLNSNNFQINVRPFCFSSSVIRVGAGIISSAKMFELTVPLKVQGDNTEKEVILQFPTSTIYPSGVVFSGDAIHDEVFKRNVGNGNAETVDSRTSETVCYSETVADFLGGLTSGPNMDIGSVLSGVEENTYTNFIENKSLNTGCVNRLRNLFGPNPTGDHGLTFQSGPSVRLTVRPNPIPAEFRADISALGGGSVTGVLRGGLIQYTIDDSPRIEGYGKIKYKYYRDTNTHIGRMDNRVSFTTLERFKKMNLNKDSQEMTINFAVSNAEGATTGFCPYHTSPLMVFFNKKRPHFRWSSDFPIFNNLKTHWPEPNHPGYFLVMDRNGDKKISLKSEVFGSSSKAQNGFKALNLLDSNKDKIINFRDKAFSKLYLWKDKNGDGIGDPSELISLKKKKIQWISLKYKGPRVKQYGDRAEEREYSTFAYKDKKGILRKNQVIDVWFTPYKETSMFLSSNSH